MKAKIKIDIVSDVVLSLVSTIVFNRKSAVTGAQPVEVFKHVLTELMNEQNQN